MAADECIERVIAPHADARARVELRAALANDNVAGHDGLAAAAVAAFDVDVDALAAFATALFNRTRLANIAAGYGETHQLVLDAANGRLIVAARGELALVVLADRDAGAGLIRVALQRAVKGRAVS